MRIDKFLSECGIATRKEAAKAGKAGLISVDGKCVRDLSVHINPEASVVTYCGKTVEYRRFTYVMLNKPTGYVSATDDKSLPYVTELLPPELRKMQLFPVGRLDRDTVGLMILTNNGKLAHTLLSPKKHVTKVYSLLVDEPLAEGITELFLAGVTLKDGYECKSAILKPNPDRMGAEITLTEGKYHQIKRMIASTGNRVTFLERIRFADIELDRKLARGEWRMLTDEEIAKLEEAGKNQI